MNKNSLFRLLAFLLILSFSCEDTTPDTDPKDTNSGRYPDYNTNPLPPDPTGMTSNAVQLAAKMKLGWNMGNSLEAIGGETAWGNPLVSAELIDMVKQSGFNAVRIPCSWDQHMENAQTAKIDQVWLDRVKEVVKYCTDRDMYVLLNIHWDGGWLENNCTEAKKVENNFKQKAFWEQIATHLREFDEHLLFASANEPNIENSTQMSVLQSYHQTFVDAVRSTGGKNSYRVLVIQGPSTDIEKTNQLMGELPVDEVDNRMMAEIHYYTPWNFCGLEADADWGKMFYYWGPDFHSTTETDRNANWGEEEFVAEAFHLMESQFIEKGVPVILGEYGAMKRTNLTGDALQLHLNSRAYYHEFVTKKAIESGIVPFFWDNGALELGTGIYDRFTNQIADKQTLDALINGTK
ncbi:MAG: glycoside hydrolase family 5 protein [Imperialibacter sp.]|uniref:glycoside hydrolase family 5 protein n=1 Tax=Imperialibacter sp. TaxID=2038411 RepID=UPI0032EDAC54